MMRILKISPRLWLITLLCVFVLLPLQKAAAHCDGMDGPVVKAAREALDNVDINRVLFWIPKDNEPEVKALFQKAVAVRKLKNAEAKALADMYFFETIVRLHRAGEGEPYTGLKPAGRDLGPALPAADKAIENGSLEEVNTLLTETVQKGLEERFAAVMHTKDFKKTDTAAGREYAEAYVNYVHYVEQIYETAHHPKSAHDRKFEGE